MGVEIKKVLYLLFLQFQLKILLITSFFISKKKDNNTLLLLAWQFPPFISGGVYRPLSIARYAKKFGWDVTVIAGPDDTKNPDAGEHLLSKLSNFNIIRVRKNFYKNNKIFKEIDGGYVNALKVFIESVKKVKVVPKVIIATGPPFHTFLSASFLKKYFKSKLVLDYRDEWNLCPFDFVEKNKSNLIWEKKILKNADCAIFTTESMEKMYLRNFSNYLKKKATQTILNGWEKYDFIAISKNAVSSINRIIITYAGGMQDDCLSNFLKLVSRTFEIDPSLAKSVKFQFVGNKSSRQKSIINSFIYSHNLINLDHVDQENLVKIISNSNGLILFLDNRFDRYLPGKLFDYLAFKKPIIALGKSYETSILISNLKAGYNLDYSDVDNFKEILISLKNNPTAFQNNNRLDNWLENNTREKMVERFVELINRV